MTVHVHDAGRDGFDRTKRPRRQANGDEHKSQNAGEKDFRPANGEPPFCFPSFHAVKLQQNDRVASIEKIARRIEKRNGWIVTLRKVGIDFIVPA
jgi:hypothetical protein